MPICRSCLDCLYKKKLPPASLANDMGTGYGPERLYQDNVTVMEMLCASPYITTFVCLTIEARYRLEGASLDPTAHMTRHHLDARGNTITFPLVWEDLFRRLHHPCRPAPEPQRALRRAPSNPQNQQDGPDLVDQFQPRYFAMAFAFCFKYGTARPDRFITNSKDPSTSRRQQKDSDTPTVDIHDWAAIISRRVEAQFRRDWNFGFVLWNYLFRTMVNLQGNTYFYSQGGKKITSDEFLQGSTELRDQLLRGKYTDIPAPRRACRAISPKSSNQYVPRLSAAAKKLAQDCNAKCRNIPGTHETRNLMR